MRRPLRMIMALLFLFLLALLPVARPMTAGAGPPSPVLPAGHPGSWYVGATPPGFDPTKPVLVFVHGKGGDAAVWWAETAYHGTNDMYAYAYSHGYRTAFVDLQPEGDMWINGYLLRQELAEITGYFGVEKVVVIAHSKGGVDTGAATAFFGAGPMIQKVITLGTPHWGTPLADLAYSTWTWWLGALLGARTDATYVMQTGYMAWFRELSEAAGETVPYYTLGGRRCGPFLTALWWGCVYLAGEDDGVVPMASSHKPRATIVADGWWDHDEIRMGSRTWSVIESMVLAYGGPPGVATGTALPGAAGSLSNMLLRGGEVEGATAGQPFPLESGVRKVSFTIYASSPTFTARLVGPDGVARPVQMRGQVPAGEVLAGAWIGNVAIAKPAAGEWRLEISAQERAGYLMTAAIESSFAARLKLNRLVAAPGTVQSVGVSFSQEPDRAQVNGGLTLGEKWLTTFTGRPASLTLPAEEGVYNLTVTVSGTLADGSAFERTLVGSIAVFPE